MVRFNIRADDTKEARKFWFKADKRFDDDNLSLKCAILGARFYCRDYSGHFKSGWMECNPVASYPHPRAGHCYCCVRQEFCDLESCFIAGLPVDRLHQLRARCFKSPANSASLCWCFSSPTQRCFDELLSSAPPVVSIRLAMPAKGIESGSLPPDLLMSRTCYLDLVAVAFSLWCPVFYFLCFVVSSFGCLFLALFILDGQEAAQGNEPRHFPGFCFMFCLHACVSRNLFHKLLQCFKALSRVEWRKFV